MLHVLKLPCQHYTPFLESALTFYDASLPAAPHRPSYERSTADDLQRLRTARDRQLEVGAVLDQLDWSTDARDVEIAGDGRLLRNILSGAIGATAGSLGGIAEGEVMPFTDLSVYDDSARQIAGLAALLRIVQRNEHSAQSDEEGAR